MKVRIGQGFDAHRFTSGSYLMLSGVKIAHEHGLAAHSDGDVVIHALCDALLGALALGDIGQHFPDSSDEFKGIDSRVLLRSVIAKANEHNYTLGNVDITIIAQAPKMETHISAMRDVLAQDLNTSIENISIKATTTEGMGFTGRGEGIAVQAVVLIQN